MSGRTWDKVFRVTTYEIAEGEWPSGSTFPLQLKQPLLPNYFVIVQPVSIISGNSPADVSFRISADPFGTGDLTSTGDASSLKLTREGTANGVVGAIVVVECLEPDAPDGFRLLDVDVVSVSAGSSPGVDASVQTPGVTMTGNTVLFGGFRGGGMSTAGTDTEDWIGIAGRIGPPTATQYTYSRYGAHAAGNDKPAHTVTVYIVDWGENWTIQSANITGTNGGADVDASGEYSSNSIDPVLRDRTWIWGSGITDIWPHGYGEVMTLGNGQDENASESVVSAGSWSVPTSRLTTIFTMTHPELRVDHVFRTSSTQLSGELNDTIDPIEPINYTVGGVGGSMHSFQSSQFGLLYVANSGTTSTDIDEALVFVAPSRPGLTTGSNVTTLAGWLQQVDFGGVQAVQTPSGCVPGPGQYMIFPDAAWSSSLLSSSSSEDDRQAGEVASVATNEGGMRPFQSGDVDEDLTIRYLIGKSGGIGGAHWFWRDSTDDSGQAIGWNHWTFFHGAHAHASATGSARYGLSAGYSKKSDKIVSIVYSGAGQIFSLHNLDMDAGEQDWTLVDALSLPDAATDGNPKAQTDIVELNDGSLRIFVLEDIDTGSGEPDFSMYASNDDGASSLLKSRLINEFSDSSFTTDTPEKVRAAVSGDWIRLAWNSGANLRTLVSADRGGSWSAVESLSLFSNGDTIDPYAWDMCGLDDASGSFLLWANTGSDGRTMYGYSASRDEGWASDSDLDLAYTSNADLTANLNRVACTAGTDFVWVVLYYQMADSSPNANDPSSDEGFQIVLFDRDDPSDSSKTVNFGSASGTWRPSGSTLHSLHYKPAFMKLMDCGRELVLIGNNLLADGSDYQNGSFVLRLAGWSLDPIQSKIDQEFSQSDNALSLMYWWVPFGSPVASASAQWALSNNNTTVSWNAQRLNMIDTGAGDYNILEHVSNTLSEQYKNNFFCGFKVRVLQGHSALSTQARNVGVRVKAHGTNGWRAFVTCTTTLVGIVDLVSNTAVTWVDTPDMADNNHRVHFGVAPNASGVPQAYLRVMNVGDDWDSRIKWENRVGPISLTTTASLTMDAIEWGHFDNNAGETNESNWQEFFVTTAQVNGGFPRHGGQSGQFDNPGGITGKLTSTREAYLKRGLKVRWGGGGGLVTDVFDGYTRHSYPREHVISVDSPRVYWQSTDDAQHTITFDYGSQQRSHHEGVAMFGTRSREAIIEYNNTDSWSSPLATYAMNADLVASLSVYGIIGDTLVLDDSAASRQLKRGIYEGMFLRATSGSAAGKTWRISGHPGRVTMQLESDTATAGLTAAGLATGDNMVLFGDRMSTRFAEAKKFRFFRIVFPAEETDTGKHRLGTIVAGPVKDFDVPLDWSWRDNEQPNTTRQRTKSGITWNFSEGPSGRVVDGRLVGDVDRWREEFNAMQRSLSNFDVKPIVLILDDEDYNQRLHLVYSVAGGGSDNDGWLRNETDSAWNETGDQIVSFEEVT